MPKRRTPIMNLELLEYLKFLHIHNLVDIITIIESIPIYYQTQVRRIIIKNNIENNGNANIINQKMKLHNITYIARHGFNFSFPKFKFDFQTYRMGPFSLDIDNELQNLVNSEIFNNAVSSKKQYAKRYMINEYDKEAIISMFKGPENYRSFLETVENRDIYFLKDISYTLLFHNYYTNNSTSRMYRLYIKNDRNKYKLLKTSLKGLVSWKKYNMDTYIKELIGVVLDINQLRERSLQNLSF